MVDDEPLARDELGFLLRELGVDLVGEANGATKALDLLDKESPDVVFVDLRMPGPDGIALADAIRTRHPGIAVVVVSAHDDGAFRAYEAQVMDYLLKPVRLERLRTTIDRVRQRPEVRNDEPLDRLAVKRRGGYVVVDVVDIIYFHVQDELVWAETADDRYNLDMTLTALERSLPAQEFFRSHRSSLVRLDCIQSLEPSGTGTYTLLLKHPDGARVPLARERVKQLRALIPFAG